VYPKSSTRPAVDFEAKRKTNAIQYRVVRPKDPDPPPDRSKHEQRHSGIADGDGSGDGTAGAIVGAAVVGAALACILTKSCRKALSSPSAGGAAPPDSGPDLRGCCSWHGGIAGCSFGVVTCVDGSRSPGCRCN
jgi:hypothetical protein